MAAIHPSELRPEDFERLEVKLPALPESSYLQAASSCHRSSTARSVPTVGRSQDLSQDTRRHQDDRCPHDAKAQHARHAQHTLQSLMGSMLECPAGSRISHASWREGQNGTQNRMPHSHDAVALAAVSHAAASGQPDRQPGIQPGRQPGSLPCVRTAESWSNAQGVPVTAPQSGLTPTPAVIIVASKAKATDSWQRQEDTEPSVLCSPLPPNAMDQEQHPAVQDESVARGVLITTGLTHTRFVPVDDTSLANWPMCPTPPQRGLAAPTSFVPVTTVRSDAGAPQRQLAAASPFVLANNVQPTDAALHTQLAADSLVFAHSPFVPTDSVQPGAAPLQRQLAADSLLFKHSPSMQAANLQSGAAAPHRGPPADSLIFTPNSHGVHCGISMAYLWHIYGTSMAYLWPI